MEINGRKMICRNLKGLLENEIRNNCILPGAPILSTKQIAEKYNVSLVTANKAVNSLVAEGLLYRIHGSGTFVAEGKKNSKENYNIGIVTIADLIKDNSTEIAFGMFFAPAAEYLSDIGGNIRYFSYQDIFIPEKFSELDGLLVSSACIDPATSRNLQALSIPVVVLQHECIWDDPFHQVIPDLFGGFKKAAALLHTRGHKKVYLASGESPHCRVRVETFIKAALCEGFEHDDIYPVLHKEIIGDNGRLIGQKIAEKILNEKKADAVFSTSDFISFGILDKIYEAFLQPGSDIVVVSYDDFESDGLCPFGKPVLTSIRNPRKEISRQAALLLERVLKENEKCIFTIKVPTQMIIRSSAVAEQKAV